jgi:hypothetical protein
MVDKTWRNEWLILKSVKHKIQTLADARVNRCDHSAGRAGPRSGPTGEMCAVQIGTELLLHGTSHTVSGLRAVPAQRPYVP